MPLKLTKQQVQDIITLLSTTTLSQKEIGEKFNVTQRTISGINIGETWVQENISYPIRKNISYPTHKKTNNFQPIYKTCIICKKPINNTSTYCPTCWGLEHRVVKDRPTRDVLKNLIRTLPFTKIGEQYGVSDNAIRKWCDSYNLPRKKSDITAYSDEEWVNI